MLSALLGLKCLIDRDCPPPYKVVNLFHEAPLLSTHWPNLEEGKDVDQVALTRQVQERYKDFLVQRRHTPVSLGTLLQRFEWMTFLQTVNLLEVRKQPKASTVLLDSL